jgi:hypothetical protein
MALPDTIWQGGQMTDLPNYTGAFDGTELFEIVAPGNAAQGLNYSMTTAQLAAAFGTLQTAALPILSGATLGTPLLLPVFPTRFLVKKNTPSASYINLASSVLYPAPVLIKDEGGNADVYPITVTFFGGELADGLSSVTISTPYGGYWFNPLPALIGPGWYIGSA